MNQTYPSRIDIWLIIIVCIAIVWAGFYALSVFQSNPAESYMTLGVSAFTFALCSLLSLPCTYTLRDNDLLIRSGIIHYCIFYKDIISVEKTSSVWAAPALSLQRVKISLSQRFYLISPKQRDTFIEELQKRLPGARA